jgi:hypothetical protein
MKVWGRIGLLFLLVCIVTGCDEGRKMEREARRNTVQMAQMEGR